MTLSMIVAVAENGVIGDKNRLLWDLPRDMQYFRKMTEGHAVIMGHKTYQSIGRPLPRRLNIIITRKPDMQVEGCTVVHSPQEAIEVVQKSDETEAFIIGGAQIYIAMFPMVDRVYFNRVHASPEGDVSFPVFPTSEWKEVSCEEYPADTENAFAMTFLVYERVK